MEEQPTLSVSTAGGLEDEAITLPLCREVIDRSVLVSEDEILDAFAGCIARTVSSSRARPACQSPLFARLPGITRARRYDSSSAAGT